MVLILIDFHIYLFEHQTNNYFDYIISSYFVSLIFTNQIYVVVDAKIKLRNLNKCYDCLENFDEFKNLL